MIRLLLCCGSLLLLLFPAFEVGAAPKKRRMSVAAGDTAACTIRSMHGLQKKGGIDPRLAALRKQLSRAPFSSYKTIRLVQSKGLSIAQGSRDKASLPNGQLLRLTFKEKLLLKNRLRLRMHLSITKPRSKKSLVNTLFTIADGGTMLVAGSKYQGGTLIVGVTCKSR